MKSNNKLREMTFHIRYKLRNQQYNVIIFIDHVVIHRIKENIRVMLWILTKIYAPDNLF